MTDAAWQDAGEPANVGLAESHAMTAREVFEQHLAFVWRTLRCQNVAPRDLEDVAQEVFVVIFQKLPRYEERGHIRGWIYRICLHAASSYRRRARVRREVLVHEVPEPPRDGGGALASSEFERFHASEQLMALLATLDEDKRAVFALHEIEQIGIPEVAEILGCPVGTAYSRLAAAKRQLVEQLSKDAENDK